jgi:hypothetical protein
MINHKHIFAKEYKSQTILGFGYSDGVYASYGAPRLSIGQRPFEG